MVSEHLELELVVRLLKLLELFLLAPQAIFHVSPALGVILGDLNRAR